MGAEVGKRFIYIKTSYFDNDSCQSLQPPLVLPRRGDAGYSVYRRSVDAKSICPSPTGEARWGLKLESGSYISRQVTLTMIPANHFSPLSFSPVGEMQVTPYIEGVSMPRVSVPPLRGRLGGG